MILTLLYHRVAEGKYANSFEMMQAHLKYISKSYPVVWPGERTGFFQLSVCLTFDDGYFDFYHYVFPLLKKYHLKAILAVPTNCIESSTNKSTEKRLLDADYCTWPEIIEMHQSGWVKIASHSHTHVNLLSSKADIAKEILLSKKILEKKLDSLVDTFIYPYGKFQPNLQKQVQDHYQWVFRIGGAINLKWNPLLYRISADQLSSFKAPFSVFKFLCYAGKWMMNRLRKR